MGLPPHSAHTATEPRPADPGERSIRSRRGCVRGNRNGAVVFAALVSGHLSHAVARPWLDGVLSSGQTFTVTSGVAASVVRLLTNDRFMQPAAPPAQAFAYLRALREQPGYVPLELGTRHLEIFERLCIEYDATGDLVPDAYLAALAIEHGCTLVSLDRDFARFEALRWERPG